MLRATDVKPDNMLLYCKNIEAMIQDDITHNPPRMHALVTASEGAPVYLAESQPLVWTSLLDATRISEKQLHVKLADLGAGNDFIHVPSW